MKPNYHNKQVTRQRDKRTRAQTKLSMLLRHKPTSNRVIGVEVRLYQGCKITCDGIETQASNHKARTKTTERIGKK